MEVILISGKAQSGKDTFANALCEQLQKIGKRVLVTHFADFLKFYCQRYLSWDGNKDAAGRRLLQVVGTDIVRKNYYNTWVDIMVALLRGVRTEYDYVLIPDTRFPNEIERMISVNNDVKYADKVWALRVERPNYDNGLTVEQKRHPSETSLDDYQFTNYYLNIGDFATLKADAVDWVEEITNREEE